MFSSSFIPTPCTSDHSLVTTKPKASPAVPFQGIIFQYTKDDWDGFSCYMAEALPFSLLHIYCFKTPHIYGLDPF